MLLIVASRSARIAGLEGKCIALKEDYNESLIRICREKELEHAQAVDAAVKTLQAVSPQQNSVVE